jgi:uncharacterized protein YjdB
MKKMFYAGLIACTIGNLFTACRSDSSNGDDNGGNGNGGGNTVTSITLDKSEITLLINESVTLKATVTPANTSIEWTSSKDAVASVDKNGKVTAKTVGQAEITAKAGDKTAKCIVTVASLMLRVLAIS